MPIQSFKDARLDAILSLRTPKRFPADLIAVTRRKLVMLDAAVQLDDLRVPPANRLEALKGDRKGQYSVRVNDQFRSRLMSSSWITLRLIAMTAPKPTHPGEILREEFLLPMGMTAGKVARAVGVPRTRIERLVKEEVDLTPDTALRLARLFGTTPQFWLNLQTRFALETTSDIIADELGHIEPLQMAS